MRCRPAVRRTRRLQWADEEANAADREAWSVADIRMKAHMDVREGESDMDELGSSVPTEPSSGYPSRAAPNRSQDPG